MKQILIAATLVLSAAYGASVNNADDIVSLNGAIVTVNMEPGDSTIHFTRDIYRDSSLLILRPLNTDGAFGTVAPRTLTIEGNDHLFTNQSGFFFPGFFARTEEVVINNLTFYALNHPSMTSQGGGGVQPGGGGAGMGSALFIYDSADVTLNNCSFVQNICVGGDGGVPVFGTTSSSGGGGGVNGPGGHGVNDDAAGGGGGFGGGGGRGNEDDSGGGGAGSGSPGEDAADGGAGGTDFGGTALGNDGGDPGAGVGTSDLGAGGGGAGSAGGGGESLAGLGGGGGGLGDGFEGGNGSLGGGGGGTTASDATGGDGGFGGGGGASSFGGGTSEFGGTSGSDGVGGAGAGLGGAIFMMEGCTLTLTGTAVFAGNTALGGVTTDGTQALSAGSDIFMMSGSDLTFNSSETITIPTPIEGNLGVGGTMPMTGSLTQMGSGMVTLNGANTYSRDTFVTAGELRINGSTTTDITVTGGTLSGNLTTLSGGATTATGTVILSAGGTIAPGTDEIGAMEFADVFDMGGGTLKVKISPSAISDTIESDAGIMIGGGTLLAESQLGNYIAGTQYVVSTSSAVGDFDNCVATFPNVDNISCSTSSSIIITILENRIARHQTIDKGPPTIVLDCILETDALEDPLSDFGQVVVALGFLDSSQVNTALTTLSPNCFAALEWINARNASRLANILDQRPWCCDSGWLTVYGNLLNQRKDYNFLRPFKADAIGVALGRDFLFCDCWTLGGALNWTYTDFTWKKDRGDGSINRITGALYGNTCWCDLNIDLSLQGGAIQNTTNRHIEFAFIDRTARGSFWSYFFTGHLALDYTLQYGYFEWGPFALTDYHFYYRDGFTERGAQSIDLVVRSKDQHMMRIEGGIQAALCLPCLHPYIALSWIGETPLHTSHQKATFIDQSCLMNISSYWSFFNFVSPTIGIDWTSCHGYAFIGEYKGVFNNRTSIHQFEARLERSF